MKLVEGFSWSESKVAGIALHRLEKDGQVLVVVVGPLPDGQVIVDVFGQDPVATLRNIGDATALAAEMLVAQHPEFKEAEKAADTDPAPAPESAATP